MALNLDVSKLTQAAAMKATPRDNCIVLDLGTGTYPRDIEVRLPDDDGARQNALWDGSLDLSVNDEVLCFEYSGISAWRIMGMGGNDGGAGKVRVSKVWDSVFGDVALQSDADGRIGIGIAMPSAALEVFDTAQAQLRLAFGATKYAEFSFDTSHLLTIDTTSVGHILLNATVRIVDEILHEGDFDTKISLTNDKISLTAGGLLMFEAIEIAGQDTLDLGDVVGGGDVDIDFNDGQMSLQGSDGFLGVGIVAPSQLFEARKDQNTATLAQVRNDNSAAGAAAGVRLVVDGGAANAGLQLFGPNDVSRPDTMLFFSGGAVGGGLKFESDAGPIVLETSFVEAMRIDTNQNIGIGGTLPQGQIHAYDSISGFIIWEYDGLNATIRTIIPNGTGDILYRLTAMYVLRDSVAAVASGTTDVSNGASVNLTVGSNTVRLRVNADGSADIARTAGTDTIKVALVLRWL